jgi:hypothetical protein
MGRHPRVNPPADASAQRAQSFSFEQTHYGLFIV